jgi:hypothetical protein
LRRVLLFLVVGVVVTYRYHVPHHEPLSYDSLLVTSNFGTSPERIGARPGIGLACTLTPMVNQGLLPLEIHKCIVVTRQIPVVRCGLQPSNAHQLHVFATHTLHTAHLEPASPHIHRVTTHKSVQLEAGSRMALIPNINVEIETILQVLMPDTLGLEWAYSNSSFSISHSLFLIPHFVPA